MRAISWRSWSFDPYSIARRVTATGPMSYSTILHMITGHCVLNKNLHQQIPHYDVSQLRRIRRNGWALLGTIPSHSSFLRQNFLQLLHDCKGHIQETWPLYHQKVYWIHQPFQRPGKPELVEGYLMLPLFRPLRLMSDVANGACIFVRVLFLSQYYKVSNY